MAGDPSTLPLSAQVLSQDGLDLLEDGPTLDARDGTDNGRTPDGTDDQTSESSSAKDQLDSFHKDQRQMTLESATRTRSRSRKRRKADSDDGSIIGMQCSRGGHVIVTITRTSVTIWQSKPTVVLTSVIRAETSLKTFGHNVSLLLRPDTGIVVVETSSGYMITYSLAIDYDAKAYQLYWLDGGKKHNRNKSVNNASRYNNRTRGSLFDGSPAVFEANLRFRMAIKIDAGISTAMALEEELVVATTKAAAVQCILWQPSKSKPQTTTALLSRMQWLGSKDPLKDMVFDRPMNLFTWVTSDGRAFAVQRQTSSQKDAMDAKTLFQGHRFHNPTIDTERATKTAINSKFSLIAVACESGSIYLYAVRDYSGGITLLRELLSPVGLTTSGLPTTLLYSPDRYCLFLGFERGWMTWSVHGQPGAMSFGIDGVLSGKDTEAVHSGAKHASWISNGLELVVVGAHSSGFSILQFARSAMATCFTPANLAHSLLQTAEGLMVYQGHGTSDTTTISSKGLLWHHVQAPLNYIFEQGPMRAAVTSSDGRYLAIAGQRGLAHYSLSSGRWKVFEDEIAQNEFLVRGGMCWLQHLLVAAVETSSSYELRVYSRELPLDGRPMHVEQLSAPVFHMGPSGEDSILVYSHENMLDHYIMVAQKKSVRLVKVGQIGLHGIIRAPARVRSMSWIVPEHQLQGGDPSQDVAVASVMFLLDGKLVLLQPATTEEGDLKYDMRIIALNIEYYLLARDVPSMASASKPTPGFASDVQNRTDTQDNGLQDSLWAFDGQAMRVWTDVQDMLVSASTSSEYGGGRDLPAAVCLPLDFYPLSVLLHKGLLFGVEPELAGRRESGFSYFRTVTRTSLLIPDLLRHHLAHYNSPAALHLSHTYSNLPYFAHALEVLLHNVLDAEVERASSASHNTRPLSQQTITEHNFNSLDLSSEPPSDASSSLASDVASSSEVESEQDVENGNLLPTTLSFLSSFPKHYLSIILNCTRKTELRSWRTLFNHLPPVQTLFRQCLDAGDLETASGYLIVLHTLEGEADRPTSPSPAPSPSSTQPDEAPSPPLQNEKGKAREASSEGEDPTLALLGSEVVELLKQAISARKWGLAKEVCGFLRKVDEDGAVLKRVLMMVDPKLVPGDEREET
ncbi:MAG: hypothetical protein M1828_004509 [Chrysothrix sp. TS-e1954]|nr:MAG: hypothetical protein M1828_004509 [Chrysothrix sp. TS-e1954]